MRYLRPPAMPCAEGEMSGAFRSDGFSSAHQRGPKDQKVHLTTVVPGPKSQALRRREDAHIAPGLQGYALMAGIVVDHALGSAVTDVDGNTFLDFIGAIGVGSLGHAHPRVVDAVQRQVAR